MLRHMRRRPHRCLHPCHLAVEEGTGRSVLCTMQTRNVFQTMNTKLLINTDKTDSLAFALEPFDPRPHLRTAKNN